MRPRTRILVVACFGLAAFVTVRLEPSAVGAPNRPAAGPAAEPGRRDSPDTERLEILDVASPVEGRRIIASILPEGSRVAPGQVVCVLESWDLKDALTNQEIVVATAGVRAEEARLGRQVVEIRLREYLEGTYPSELEAAEVEATLTDAEYTLARDELDRLKRETQADELARRRAEIALARARVAMLRAKGRLEVLPTFTREARLKELQAAIQRASGEVSGREEAKGEEQRKAERLRRQIERCQLKAPRGGAVVYARPGLGEGAAVDERHVIFRIVALP